MADKKISELTAYTSPVDADVLPIVSTAAGATKKMTWAIVKSALLDYFTTALASIFQPIDATLTSLASAIIGEELTFAENAALRFDDALSADGKYTGMVAAGTAGETLAFGDAVYFKTADSKWWLTDADAAATAGGVMIGICVLAGAGNAATKVLVFGTVRADTAFPTLTIGAPAYLGTTAGDIVTTAPSGTDDVVRVIGFGRTADELFVNPSPDYATCV